MLDIVPAEDQVRVRTRNEEFTAPTVVVAAGAWTEPLLAPLAIPLPAMTTTEEQVFHFSAAQERPGGHPWTSFMHRGTTIRYGLQSPGEGIKLGEHHAGRVCDPEPVDAEWLPGVRPEPVTETTCLYTTTPTEEFVIERFGRVVVG